MKMIDSIEYPLRTSDFDYNDNIKPYAILDYFQDIAGYNALNLGMGFEKMKEKGLLWVVTRIRLEIIKSPKQNEHIKVITWPRKRDKLYFYRDYMMEDLNGNCLVKGTSNWVLIDANTRRLSRALDVNYTGEYVNNKCFDYDLEKYKIDESKLIFGNEHIVCISDLDHNGHLNNARYADFVINSLDKLLQPFNIFDISFIKEAKKGDIIKTYYYEENDNFYFIGYNDGEKCFTAKINFWR